MTGIVYGPRHGGGCFCGGCQARAASKRRNAELLAVLSLADALRDLGSRLGMVSDEDRAEPLSVQLDRGNGLPAWVFR